MPNQNQYVEQGMRGFTAPDAELFLMGLFDPSFDGGWYDFGYVLGLGMIVGGSSSAASR
jgi:hypothetical protein